MQQVELEQELVSIVRRSKLVMTALENVRTLALPCWCIGAGAIRTLVWDELHGFEHLNKPADIDVVYFDAAEDDTRAEARHEKQLRRHMPGVQWEVTNQATVHVWFAEVLGQEVSPLQSMEAGVATWPEIATCVGVNMDADGKISVIAPHGLDDLFGLVVRHNPARVSEQAFRKRLMAKKFAERWPLLKIMVAQ